MGFNYKGLKYTLNNLFYFFLLSSLICSFVYFMVNQFKIDLTYSIRYLIILFISPIILIIYYLFTRNIKNVFNNVYKVAISYDGYVYEGLGFVDSGNKLCAYGKSVILVEKKYINYQRNYLSHLICFCCLVIIYCCQNILDKMI